MGERKPIKRKFSLYLEYVVDEGMMGLTSLKKEKEVFNECEFLVDVSVKKLKITEVK